MPAMGRSVEKRRIVITDLDNYCQFVPADDRKSILKLTSFGMPQRSTHRTFFFHVTDLQDKIQLPCFQYADNIAILAHGRPNNSSIFDRALNEHL